MSTDIQAQKVCVACGMDVSAQKRTKDKKGNYYCSDCWTRIAGQPEPSLAVPKEASSVIEKIWDGGWAWLGQLPSRSWRKIRSVKFRRQGTGSGAKGDSTSVTGAGSGSLVSSAMSTEIEEIDKAKQTKEWRLSTASQSPPNATNAIAAQRHDKPRHPYWGWIHSAREL